MDYEMKIMDARISGREDGEKRGKEIGKDFERRAGVKKWTILFVKKNYSDSEIFDNIKEIYGQYFSDDELKQFIAEAKTSIPME